MSSIEYPDLKSRLIALKNNPIAATNLVMGLIEEALEDDSALFADPGQPLPFLIESNVVNTCAAIESVEILDQRSYPVMAVSEEGLYCHMTDKDYRNMFSKPGSAPFYIVVSEDEIIEKAIPIQNSSTRKLTLGKHSQIVVNNIAFTFQYPINFLVKSHGAVEIVYDGTKPSHLQTLRGNKIEADIIKIRGEGGPGDILRMMRIPVDVMQMRLTSYIEEPDSSAILQKTYTFDDKFFAIRAFRMTATGQWVEMVTTHSDQVFDVAKPTILAKVVDNTVSIELPHIYVQTNMVSRSIRIEIYTTKGDLIENFDHLNPEDFKYKQIDLDNDDAGVFTAAGLSLTTLSVVGRGAVSGGTNAPTFEERRDRVMRNVVYDNVMPISDAQVETVLQDLGFDSMMTTDLITTRTYLANRVMPKNTQGLTTTGIDTAMMTMRATFESLVTLETVRDNEEQITIMPDTLYKDKSGEVVIVPDAERHVLDSLAGEELVDELQKATYLTTPLHYVLDARDQSFEARPYFLTNPKVEVKSYAASNDGIEVFVSSSANISISYTDTGYSLRVETSSNEPYRQLDDSQVHVQLAFIVPGTDDLTYANGTLLQTLPSKERIFEFRIDTNWMITEDHLLMTTNFTEPGSAPPRYEVHLETLFSLIWSVSDYAGPASDVDNVLGRHLLPSNAIGVYHEQVLVHLGDELTGLWARSRNHATAREFERYTTDIPAVYERNEYYIDPQTGLPEIIEVNGVKQLHIKHPKGDPRFDEYGDPVYKHRKGDPVYRDGGLVLVTDRKTERWWEVALFDANYRYATREYDTEYYASVPDVLVTWVNTVLGGVKDLLERTSLYFHPKNTLRYFEAIIDDTELTTIYGSHEFVIMIYVTDEVYRNNALRSAMETAAIQALTNALDTTRVTRLNLEDAIKTALGSDGISVNLEGLGGTRPANVVTIMDNTSRLTISKRPALEADGTIAVRDAVEVLFRRHSTAVM